MNLLQPAYRLAPIRIIWKGRQTYGEFLDDSVNSRNPLASSRKLRRNLILGVVSLGACVRWGSRGAELSLEKAG